MYAEKTSVPIDRSQGEIKKIFAKYGATAFSFAETADKAMVQFEMKSRRIKFILPMPVYGIAVTENRRTMNQDQVAQLGRSRWRALVIVIKAKLECVESGITTLEQEFMAQIVLPNGRTVGEEVTPAIESAYKTGQMVPLLGAGT